MIKNPWSIPRILLSILSVLFIIYWLFFLVTAIQTGAKPAILFYDLILLIVFIYIFATNYKPECLIVVGKYMRLKELKERIKKENFQKIDCSAFQGKYVVEDIYYSDTWAFIGDVYIPRSLILTLGATTNKKTTTLYVLTKNGYTVRMAKMENLLVRRYLKQIKKKLPECAVSYDSLFKNYQSTKLEDSKKQFKKLSKSQFYQAAGLVNHG